MNESRVRLISLGVFGIWACALIFFVIFGQPFAQRQNQPPKKEAVPPVLVPRSLDGVMVPPEKQNPSLAAISVDNFVAARPQSGLLAAGVIFEAPAEAAITRFLALVPLDALVSEIGPIRSARPYFIDWALEFKAPLVHVGGSPAALVRLYRDGNRAIDEWRNEKYIWRSRSRPMPHNTYTSTANLAAAFSERKWSAQEFTPWQFKDDAPLEARASLLAFNVPHHDPAYRVRWRYERSDNTYLREQAGSEHILSDGKRVRASNVVIMFSSIKILDEIGRREIKTVGEGKAIIMRDGEVIEGVWKRPSLEVRTRFYDKDGTEIVFNRGLTWITVVPVGTAIAIER